MHNSIKNKKANFLQVLQGLLSFNFSIFQFSNLLILSFFILNSSFLISQNSLDQLQYNYYSNTNRLEYLIDAVGSTSSTIDLDNQSSANYAYDAVGQLTQDVSEGILDIDWTVSGKVKKVSIDDDGNLVADRTLEFKYDALGNRVKKIETTISTAAIQTTIYIRNATGDLISIYESNGTITERIETNISGVGIDKADEVSASSEIKTRSLGNKNYELKDHLGNVRVVVNDAKEPVDPGNPSIFQSSILNSTDYYSYGMQMPDRDYNSSNYRYGFNGMEKDDELKGNGNSYDFGARIYDPRVGVWLSTDPQEVKFPNKSPYTAFYNNPILYVDPTGEAPVAAAVLIPYLGKAVASGAADAAADFLIQTAIEYYFTEDEISIVDAMGRTDGGDIFVSFAMGTLEGLIPWKVPAKRILVPAAKTVLETSLVEMTDALQGESITSEKVMQDAGLILLGNIAGGEVSELIAKKGPKAFIAGCKRLGLPDKEIHTFLLETAGIDPEKIGKLNFQGGIINCQKTTLSLDEYLASGNAWTVTGAEPDWNKGKDWEKAFWGEAGASAIARNVSSISVIDNVLQEGDRAIVHGIRSSKGTSHVFNVIRLNGETIFMDAQLGRVIDMKDIASEGYDTFEFAVTGKIGDRKKP